MGQINFDRFTPVPNSILDSFSRDKHSPARARVFLAILRIIYGFIENRDKLEADISFSVLAKKTNLLPRNVKRAIKQLRAKGLIKVNHGGGRGHKNTYTIDFNNTPEMEEHTFYDEKGREYKELRPKE